MPKTPLLPSLAATKPTPDALPRLIEVLGAEALVRVTGLRGGARGQVLAHLLGSRPGLALVVAPDDDAADALADDLAFFLGGAGTREAPVVLRLPDDETFPFDEFSPHRATVQERLATLHHLQAGTPSLRAVVLSARALSRKQVPPERLAELGAHLQKEQELDRDDLARRLTAMGYLSAPVVEDVGTFSVRGGLVDVWSPTSAKPCRIELFGDWVETLKTFDPETQRTDGEVASLALCPAQELLFSDEGKKRARLAALDAADAANRPTAKTRELLDALAQGVPAPGIDALLPSLFEQGLAPLGDYLAALPRPPWAFVDDPHAVARALADFHADLRRAFEAARGRGEIALEPAAHYLSPDEVQAALDGLRRVESFGMLLPEGPAPIAFGVGGTAGLREAIVAHHGQDGALTPLVEALRTWRDAGLVVVVACGSVGGTDKLKRLLLDRQVMVRTHAEPFAGAEALRDPSVWAHLFAGEVSSGFVDRGSGLVVLSDEEIFGSRPRRRARARRIDPSLVEFRELSEGDVVVHAEFGIGKYLGLQKKVLAGIPGDFLLLEYAGGDKVYLPITRLRQVQKFVGADPASIKLDKLGGTAWETKKRRVKEELLKMAGDLLRIYAARQAHPGVKFSPPDQYYRQFEADFEFEPTADQQKAIDDVLGDMTSGKAMDRLICGDVGYGKTEVALRATFKAVLDHKQVAVLVPTTVLAAQHGHTFKRRFADYPVRVEVVSRYRKPEEVREVLRKLAQGQVDVVVGTHRLLGKDVHFKDLGLLVIDEEQRFGVKHKEGLKKLRTQVDVLTLTATPIPRTLHMSMAGVRDMTVIATPPADRKSIRTIVQKLDPVVLQEAIRRELARGGQVYYVHNRVDSMPAALATLQALVPEARIGVAHGQMPEGALEDVMTAFVERKHDVLLCSTIIESGLDIPSANTLIVERADMFGLAQLYQLRGRVGRSAARAYAYLLTPTERAVTADAEKRLEVLQQFSELGAGFAIASHDLEIRGAGNLLGGEQAGTIAAVGFDLYAQLLEEAVAELRGEPLVQEIDPDVNLALPAFIPEDFVPDVHQRLVLYKRFSQVGTDDALTDLRAEIIDRYGELPLEVDHLSELMRLKMDLRALRLRALEGGPGRVVLTLGQDAALDPVALAGFIQRGKGAYKLTPDLKLVARINSEAKDQDLIREAQRVVREVRKLAV